MLKVDMLNQTQIVDMWDYLREGIKMSLPPTTYGSPKQMDYMLDSLVSGKAQCWLGHEEIDGRSVPLVLITTMFTGEPGVEVRNLLIYTLTRLAGDSLSKELLELTYEKIKSFARDNSCYKIIAYTNIQKVVDIVQSLPSGKAEYVLVTLEV